MCKHGGKKTPTTAADSWQQHSKAHIEDLSSVQLLAVTLFTSSTSSHLYNPLSWVQDITASFQLCSLSPSDALSSVLMQCTNLTSTKIAINFFQMISQIQLVATCQRWVFTCPLKFYFVIMNVTCGSQHFEKGYGTLTELYEEYIQPLKSEMWVPSKHTFLEWHADGCKYAALAGGGTIYVLVLVAGLGVRVRVHLAEDETITEIANTLRQPDSSELDLAPCLLDLTADQRLSWDTLSMDSYWRSCSCKILSPSVFNPLLKISFDSQLAWRCGLFQPLLSDKFFDALILK